MKMARFPSNGLFQRVLRLPHLVSRVSQHENVLPVAQLGDVTRANSVSTYVSQRGTRELRAPLANVALATKLVNVPLRAPLANVALATKLANLTSLTKFANVPLRGPLANVALATKL